MNNAVYRKTMENLENRIDVKGLLGPKGLLQMNIKTKLYVK